MKVMRRIVPILLAAALCLGDVPLLLSAEEKAIQYTEEEQKIIYTRYKDLEPALEAVFCSDETVGYWSLVNNIEKNSAFNWALDIAAKIIEQDLDKKGYVEILTNLMTMQEGDLAESISQQSQFDDLKDAEDYIKDVIDIAGSFIGNSKISMVFDTATDGWDVITEDIEQAKYFQASIQEYTQFRQFLSAIENYAEDEELRNAADSLMGVNDTLLEKRLEYMSDNAETLAEYDAKFFLEELTFPLLKSTDLYQTDETLKWFVDGGAKIQEALLSNIGLGEFVFKSVMLVGDIGFGTADTFYRYQEMKVLADIAEAITEANSKISIPDKFASGEIGNIQVKCDYYKSLLVTHARGEYLIYQLLINDAGLLSQFRVLFEMFNTDGDTTDAWYNGQVDTLVEYYNILSNVFNVENRNNISEGKEETAYLELLNNKEYLNYIPEWEELLAEPEKYVIIDIDGDGGKELIISGDDGWGFYLFSVFGYDDTSGEIYALAFPVEGGSLGGGYVSQYYGDLMYSEQYRALVYTELNNGIYFGGREYGTIEDRTFVFDFSTWFETDETQEKIYGITRSGNTEQISEAEYRAYQNELVDLSWKQIGEKGIENWKTEYLNYIEEHGKKYDSLTGSYRELYKLVNINNDNIPELYICYGSIADGDVICSYHEGKVIEQSMYVSGFSYLEGRNLFCDSGGHMDAYHDIVYCMENGEFRRICYGDYGAEDNSNVQYDSNGYPIYKYYWNGTEVSSEEEYMRLLNEVYDIEQASSPFDNTVYDSELGRYVGNGLCDYEEIKQAINEY
ncbi:hypothetical protein B5F07_08675 [Lachnoclostridium sp. An169]|uniref:hypothetical protein n=1 Tax=Lachnoclostridium sp. An169 TaxID=1965569 RepID=UPI000B3957F6|nr:hypothetical protein [Lachnoclostridium sp. An169]OUP84200.1 hypothetical protein B5F07_08675 [Lachnoclostridium sp. An169]